MSNTFFYHLRATQKNSPDGTKALNSLTQIIFANHSNQTTYMDHWRWSYFMDLIIGVLNIKIDPINAEISGLTQRNVKSYLSLKDS